MANELSLTDLRLQTGKLGRLLMEGKTVVLTRYGMPVAKVVPIKVALKASEQPDLSPEEYAAAQARLQADIDVQNRKFFAEMAAQNAKAREGIAPPEPVPNALPGDVDPLFIRRGR